MANGKDSYYFSHDSNARNDEKILMLRAEHGWEGYGIFWVMVEMMFENKDTRLQHNKIKGLSVSYNIDITLLENVINTCINEGLFSSDGVFFWSDSLVNRKALFQESRMKRSEAGKKGMAARWKGHKIKEVNNNVITKDNKERKVKEKKVNNLYTASGNPKNGNEAKTVLELLNKLSGKKFKPTDTNLKNIKARLSENFTLEDCEKVLRLKIKDPHFIENPKYYNPETLFRPSKFEKYLNEQIDTVHNKPIRVECPDLPV